MPKQRARQPCRSCKKPILFMKTRTNKWIPVNWNVDISRLWDYDSEIMEAHFATCPDGDKFRKGDDR